MGLRIATPTDIELIGDLLRLMHTEIGIGRANEAKARVAVTDIVNKGQCIVATKGGKIVGSIGLALTSFWYSSDVFMIDQWFFVHPEFRADKNEGGENAGHASKLVEAAKAAADLRGVPLVIQVGSTKDTMAKVRWFSKRMQPFGGAFVHFPKKAA